MTWSNTKSLLSMGAQITWMVVTGSKPGPKVACTPHTNTTHSHHTQKSCKLPTTMAPADAAYEYPFPIKLQPPHYTLIEEIAPTTSPTMGPTSTPPYGNILIHQSNQSTERYLDPKLLAFGVCPHHPRSQYPRHQSNLSCPVLRRPLPVVIPYPCPLGHLLYRRLLLAMTVDLLGVLMSFGILTPSYLLLVWCFRGRASSPKKLVPSSSLE